MIQEPLSPFRISVIIPTYNHAAYLPFTLESILNQTRTPDEIIVVDDGSTDNTPEVLARYNDRIMIVRQVNCGLPCARNAGLREATGDAILFLDADDLLAATSLEILAAALTKFPNIAVAYSDAILLDSEGRHLGRFSQLYGVPHPSGYIFPEIAQHNLFPVHAALVRHSSIANFLFDETGNAFGLEDFDFWMRIAAKHEFLYIDEPLAFYRLHSSSMTQSAPRRMAESELEVQRRVFAMPEFARLTSRQRARIYCSHGVKQAMLDHLLAARQSFLHAIRIAPLYPVGYVLALSSFLSLGFLKRIILLRRRLSKNRTLQEMLPSSPTTTTVAGR